MEGQKLWHTFSCSPLFGFLASFMASQQPFYDVILVEFLLYLIPSYYYQTWLLLWQYVYNATCITFGRSEFYIEMLCEYCSKLIKSHKVQVFFEAFQFVNFITSVDGIIHCHVESVSIIFPKVMTFIFWKPLNERFKKFNLWVSIYFYGGNALF